MTAPTWLLRHVLRSLVQFLPSAIIVFLAVPVNKTILGIGIAMGALIGLLYSSVFIDDVAESRDEGGSS